MTQIAEVKMSIYRSHRVCMRVNELESKLPWYWFFWNKRYYMQQVVLDIIDEELEIEARNLQ